MKYPFQVFSLGYDGAAEFARLEDARGYIKRCLASDLKRCRERFGAAEKVKMGEDSYKIIFGANVWSTYSLVKV